MFLYVSAAKFCQQGFITGIRCESVLYGFINIFNFVVLGRIIITEVITVKDKLKQTFLFTEFHPTWQAIYDISSEPNIEQN